MKIVVFGTGNYFDRYFKYIEKFDTVIVVDNNVIKQVTIIKGYLIESPEILNEIEFDKIFICSIYCYDIRLQLISMGISERKINYFFDFEQEENDFEFYENANHGNKKKIALISHDFSVTGAQNCLLSVSEYLNKKFFHVIIGSPYDGDMRNAFWKSGSEVYVDRRLRMGKLDSIEWIKDCDIIVVNTVQLYYLLRGVPKDKAIVWWIHEPMILYNSVIPDVLLNIDYKNFHIYSVSTLADKGLKKYLPDVNINRLIFGVKDGYQKKTMYGHDKNNILEFIMVGGVSKIKGHDILISALKLLNQSEISRLKITFVGDDTTAYAKKLKEQAYEEKLPIEFLGIMSHTDTLSMIDKSDILICASREESMSAVVIEAMMYEKCTIVSNETGVAEFISNNKNAYLFNSGDEKELAKKISLVLCNRTEVKRIGQEARKTYEQFFNMEKYYQRLDIIFNKLN